ncbi:phosphatase PAP2 family protein [Alysiella crassa]|uniref:Phosphatidic acid phosphatase type 2/haloperoxidase domain-containing protein n=1 Tax=Alysiella crassa TaxID=153491 RepID=A0A376BKW6_9NEIS|nr:phosphatase PAP2 family protein [Alysiella crassa]UOP07525.1 phosphatase PAP2 family protein [Alysiella crassa]SSY70273.1 Uncharacterised protein [Alysiella crassa]
MQPRSHFAYVLAILFACLFFVLYGASSWLNDVLSRATFAPTLPFEAHFPIYPQWSLVYLSLPLAMLMAVNWLDWRAQWRWFVLLCGQLLTACVVFIAFPVHLSFAVATDVGDFWRFWLDLAHSAGMKHNYLPSLHCAFVVSTVLIFRHKINLLAQIIGWLYALMVSFSTFAIHAHHLIDIVAGWLWAFLWFYPMQKLADLSQHIADRHRLWFNNHLRFSRRHRRYALIAVILYAQYLVAPQRARLLMSGYCFLQAYDDIMDGDRPLSGSLNTECADVLIHCWQSENFTVRQHDNTVAELATLGQIFQNDLRQLATYREARADVLILLNKMKQDAVRAQTYCVFKQTELHAQLHDTFRASLNMLFYAFHSRLRADDVPELVKILAWCSAMRDWDADLACGIINIPAEKWHQADLPEPNDSTINGYIISQNPIIKAWLAQEKIAAEQEMAQLFCRLPEIRYQYGKAAYQIVKLFADSVAQFARKRYPKRFG